jgi:hypothetical protein
MGSAVAGGYLVITVGQFANACAARKQGRISALALRVWLACHEQRAKRCTAKGAVCYTERELARLAGCSVAAATRALRELHASEIISWSEERIDFPEIVHEWAASFAGALGTSAKRPVPVPRFVLKTLSRHTRPSELMAAIGHLIRCLFRRQGRIFNGGLVKASWVATVFGVAERSVHSARRWLMGLKILSQEPVHQLVMNRWGGKFVVSLVNLCRVKRARGGVKASGARAGFAPPSFLKSTSKSTSSNQTNNKPAQRAAGAGFCGEGEPRLWDIRFEDLKKLSHLEKLYRQAVSARWLAHTEANIRNFVCAAQRAKWAGGRVGAIFAGIVKKHFWHHITQHEEDAALAVLKRYREKNPQAFELRREADSARVEDPSIHGLVKTVLNRRESCL